MAMGTGALNSLNTKEVALLVCTMLAKRTSRYTGSTITHIQPYDLQSNQPPYVKMGTLSLGLASLNHRLLPKNAMYCVTYVVFRKIHMQRL